MKKIWLFIFGGYVYCFIEVLWRGKTHWSMALAGGTVVLLLSAVQKKTGVLGFLFASAVTITLTELLFGIIFNIFLKMNVWDYSGMDYNIAGQICLPYTLLWFALGFPVYYIIGQIKREIFSDMKPYR